MSSGLSTYGKHGQETMFPVFLRLHGKRMFSDLFGFKKMSSVLVFIQIHLRHSKTRISRRPFHVIHLIPDSRFRCHSNQRDLSYCQH